MRFPYRDFKRDWHPGDRFCRCRSIKMRFYRHIDIYKVEFMLNKYLKRWVQFVDTVIWITNTTEYTELIGSEVASKWFSHSWMIARTLPKQAHPGRRSPRARFAGTGGFAARGGGHITKNRLVLYSSCSLFHCPHCGVTCQRSETVLLVWLLPVSAPGIKPVMTSRNLT